MALSFQPLTPVFAAEARGIDIRAPIDAATAARIEAAMNEFGVLVFRRQHLDEDQQMAFTRWFGPLDRGFGKVRNAQSRFKTPHLADISNVDFNGDVVPPGHPKRVGSLANQLWHSDSSFQKPSAKFSLLTAHRIPSWGGNTEFADMRAAYDALPAATKAEIDNLVAEHWALHSRINMLGDENYTEEQKAALAPVLWPLVRVHPASGRKSLFIGAHTRAIEGISVPEARILLGELLEHATQPRFVYVHEWTLGDLVMWDNRSTLHRGRRYDLNEKRELRRSTTGDRPESQPEFVEESAADHERSIA
jgi:alpha-ketoglutarate-dependent 2,4-dichlorophenoxyacetate dioxygenase